MIPLKCPTMKEMFILLIAVLVLSSLLTYQIGVTLLRDASSYQKGSVRDVRKARVFENAGGRKDGLPGTDNRMSRKQRETFFIQSTRIYHRLSKIEEKLYSLSKLPVVVISKNRENITDIVVKYMKSIQGEQSRKMLRVDPQGGDEGVLKKNKFSLLLLTDTGGENPNEEDLGKFQKMNYIPVLREVLQDPSFPCFVHNIRRTFSKAEHMHSIRCRRADDAQADTSYPVGKEVIFVQRDGELTFAMNDQGENKYWDLQTAWILPSPVLRVHEKPVVLRVFVLVASFLPLRLYIDDKCRLLHYSPDSGKFLREASTTLSQLSSDLPGLGTNPEALRNNIYESVLTVMLSAEHKAWTLMRKQGNISVCGCPRCFGFLSMDFVLMSKTVEPVIVKNSERELDEQETLRTVLSLMAPHSNVTHRVAAILNDAKMNLAVNREECEMGHNVCLTDQDLVYIMDSERERLTNTKFIKIFPSANDARVSKIMDRMTQMALEVKSRTLQAVPTLPSATTSNLEGSQCHPTTDIHIVLSELERQSMETHLQQQFVEKEGNNLHTFHLRKLDAEVDVDTNYLPHQGEKNASIEPLILNISFSPTLHLEPDFDPGCTEYRVTVPYSMIRVQFTVETSHPNYKVAVDSALERTSKTFSYTLGLGENTIRLHVVDNSVRYPQTVNLYTIIIKRPTRGENSSLLIYSFNVCTIKQDCTMKYSEKEKCGLQSTNFTNWREFENNQITLPSCLHTDSHYEWYVPCKSCKDEFSCNWKFAKWQPRRCKSEKINDATLRKCLRRKKLLFLGDSTNRGIFYYILQRVNRTLIEWDKTHDMKMYTNVNQGRTAFSFAYYPQFWLPSNHRPSFHKTLYQLIKRSLPLENNHNTVLIVGGVQWLNKYHLNMIMKALKRENLSRIKLISKGLGAGFHQQTDGVLFKSPGEQLSLLSQEEDLVRHARVLGFSMVHTYNMTMSRYRDFLQGKCACHFHRVEKHEDSITPGKTTYRIKGDINAAYSELVINQICFKEND